MFDDSGMQIRHIEKRNDTEDYYDDGDISCVYDNPYYNDNLDMDQQSVEFWNSL